MKKFLLLALSTFILTGLSPLAVSNAERGYITINTSADTEIIPDTADISFSIKTYDNKSMQKATSSNKEISNKVYSLLKTMINPNDKDYIKTSDFHASPVYTYSGNKKTLDKYEVTNRITIHTKSLDKLGIMIDKAINAGATNVDSLKFSVSNYEAQCNSLIETSVKKAKNRASIAAKTMTTTIDGIKSMDVNCSTNANYNMPRVYMAKNMLNSQDSAVEETTTNISVGTVKIYANVNAAFYVK